MKTQLPRTSNRQRQSGVAVVSVLILTSILLILVASNVRTVGHLQRELRLIERKQVRQLQSGDIRTNSLPKGNLVPGAPPAQ